MGAICISFNNFYLVSRTPQKINTHTIPKNTQSRRVSLEIVLSISFGLLISDRLKTACQNSDIPYGRFTENGFIYPDLRHTFTVNARREGVHKNVVRRLRAITQEVPMVRALT